VNLTPPNGASRGLGWLTAFEQEAIRRLRANHFSYEMVARIIGCSYATVHYFERKETRRGLMKDVLPAAATAKSNATLEAAVHLASAVEALRPDATVPRIRVHLKNVYNVDVSPTTIGRLLHAQKYMCRGRLHTQLLTEQHKTNRIAFSHKMMPRADLPRIVFTDEKIFTVGTGVRKSWCKAEDRDA
jgi:IS30 family transposase